MKMALPPSGSDDTLLVVIETTELSLYIKGNPYQEKYESFKRIVKDDFVETMQFSCEGVGLESVQVFDVREGRLTEKSEYPPIFFENSVYQLVVESKHGKTLTFDHEHPGLRKAIGHVGKDNHILIGNLIFINEVGLTTFQIKENRQVLLEVTLEVYPTKLDYKEDYRKLLEEVNDEIYNLAFHFLKKTFLGASPIYSNQPSLTEFFRLLQHYYKQFLLAIERIEMQPHHQLVNRYYYVRGDQIKQIDGVIRRRLQKKANLFEDVKGGLTIHGREVLPRKGWVLKKDLSFNTLENRFVKWMIVRLIHKIEYLHDKLTEKHAWYDKNVDQKLVTQVSIMKKQLQHKLRKPFWKQIGSLDRTVMSLVLQMKPGYKDAFRIFLIVSRGLTLHGQLLKMSVKDIATLYEYWTFLKIGQILAKKYETVSQNIVKVRRDGLFVDLDQTKSAVRVFRHPLTHEKIVLKFQARGNHLPTVPQKPDILISIDKKDQPYPYSYVFDAKYRIDFAAPNTYYERQYKEPGPLEEDINTMHRYRDALVVQQDGPYERYAFGAYVLFPWNDEFGYQSHHFYKSINQVNIGGLPFLPSATTLVENFLERLINASPEEIHQEGILPRGTLDYWKSSLEEKVIVGNVNGVDRFYAHMRYRFYHIPIRNLKEGWHEAQYIALYIPKKVSSQTKVSNGITYYGKIVRTDIVRRSEIKEIPSNDQRHYVRFHVEGWRRLERTVGPVGYGIVAYTMTTLQMLKRARELPELFVKSEEELALWRMLRRLSDRVRIDLDHRSLDLANEIKAYSINEFQFFIRNQNIEIVKYNKVIQTYPLELLRTRSSSLFRQIVEVLKKHRALT